MRDSVRRAGVGLLGIVLVLTGAACSGGTHDSGADRKETQQSKQAPAADRLDCAKVAPPERIGKVVGSEVHRSKEKLPSRFPSCSYDVQGGGTVFVQLQPHALARGKQASVHGNRANQRANGGRGCAIDVSLNGKSDHVLTVNLQKRGKQRATCSNARRIAGIAFDRLPEQSASSSASAGKSRCGELLPSSSVSRVAGERAKRDTGSEQLSKWPTCRYRLSGKAKLELTFPKQGMELPGKQEKLRGHPATVAKAPADKGLHGCAIMVGKLGKQHKRSMVLTAQLNKTDCAGQVHKLADQALAHV